MTTTHFCFTLLVQEHYDKINDEYSNGHLQLIYLREGIEGIVDTINHLTGSIIMNGTDDKDDTELYEACLECLDNYLLDRS